jgi:hypothetical protein
MITKPLYTIKNISNPLVYDINEPITVGEDDVIIRPRTEKGWTLDFVFNRMDSPTTVMPWISGSTFYYWGISGETNPSYYIDNNLSFSFTDLGEIQWEVIRYSSYCDDIPTGKKYSGKTDPLCSGGTSGDFNITITFEREFEFDDCCDLVNQGGTNDLITGQTITNMLNVLTGATAQLITVEELTKKWTKDRYQRLGTLKIYLNGNPIYTLKGWEEVIPSVRSSLNPLTQIIGGGTVNSGGIHEGVSMFDIKEISYFEVPLTYLGVREHYLQLAEIYNIYQCAYECDEDYVPATFNIHILTENNFHITTEDGYNIIIENQ